MTNQEAIEILKDLWRWEHPNWLEKDIRQALDKGIEALENQTSVIRELEKIKQEMLLKRDSVDLFQSAFDWNIELIDKRISELKGEQE